MNFPPTTAPARLTRSRWIASPLAAIVGGCLLAATATGGISGTDDAVEEVLQFSMAPSSLVATSDGHWLVGLDQRLRPRYRVVRISPDGQAVPFPDETSSSGAKGSDLPLDAVEALTIDRYGIAWMLDNGRRSETTPKLVGWNLATNQLTRVLYLNAPAVGSGSFCSDLVVDPGAPYAYISDPAQGHDAALIVVNLTTGLCRRVLTGQTCVQPDPEVQFEAQAADTLTRQRLDGTAAVPHTAVDALAIDRKGEWLYFAPLQSSHIYRIPTASLRDAALSPSQLADAVETYAKSPPTSSLVLDEKGNLYIASINGRAIGRIDPKSRDYHVLTRDIRLLRPDNLTFGRDGALHFDTPTRIRGNATPTTSTTSADTTSFSLFRLQPLAPGRAGD